jgi:tellurium resistance protein TerD
VRSDEDFIFYRNLVGLGGAVEHLGDNRTGEGEGDDEQVKIDLSKIPADVKKLVFVVTIHEAEKKSQNFGQVANAFMRILNQDGGAVLAQYDLSEDYSTETAMIFGEIYRHNEEWKMKAIGAGFAGGLGPLATAHGVNVG